MPAFKPGFVVCLVAIFLTASGGAQEKPETPEKPEPPAKAIKIPDEPHAIDPASVLPASVTARLTVQFAETSLTDVVKWIQEEQKISVLLDKSALSKEGILVSEPVTDQLNDEPLYLLLDRLRTLGLGWYLSENVLHITTTNVAGSQMSTISYNLGDLFDANVEQNQLIETVMQSTRGKWSEVDGDGGGIVLLGDVMFIRHTDAIHREVAGLFAALRQHGRRTFALDPPENAELRRKLEQNVSVDFEETPLEAAILQMAQQAMADIRLDQKALRDNRVRDRAPVSLKLADEKLSTVLEALLSELNLTSILRDGVLWVTSKENAEDFRKTAVFDVRDLCRNHDEADALLDAIRSQTQGPWRDVEGVGGTMVFPKFDTLVIHQTETQLNDILQLLENYRIALRGSKPRQRKGADPKEVITRYYRLPTNMSRDLQVMLPRMVSEESWLSEQNPNAPGNIKLVTSRPTILNMLGHEVLTEYKESKGNAPPAVVVPYSVMVIRQTREVHEEIAQLLVKLESGDTYLPNQHGGIGGGLGGGGFGGGFFSIPPNK